MSEIKVGDWVMVKGSNLIFKVAHIEYDNGYDTFDEYYSESDSVYNRKDLIRIDNINHIRNMFYNAPIGSLELEVAKAINDSFEKKRLEQQYSYDIKVLGKGYHNTSNLLELYKMLYEIINKHYEVIAFMLNENDIVKVNEILKQIKEIENE
ncbi:MAG: hypothetical protein WC973_03190 [Candidatus Dojkabacteria bacterium]